MGPSDPEYSLIQTATKFYAAALCYETFPDDKVQSFGEKAERFRDEAAKIVRSFGLRSSGAAAMSRSTSSPRA